MVIFHSYVSLPEGTIWLFVTVRHGLSMALIEIDSLPNLNMGGSFHGELLVITRW